MAKPSKIKASCLILAGGEGKRLSPDKPLFEIGGVPIIERAAGVVVPLFDEVLVVTNSPEKYVFLDLPLASDERTGCGPLMGIYSGLKRVRHEAAFVCAADMPFLDEALIRAEMAALAGFDVVVPWPGKRPQFLHAVYRKRCLSIIRENLDADRYKIEDMTRRCNTLRLDADWFDRLGLSGSIGVSFSNINTIEDYRRWGDRADEKQTAEDIGVRSLAPVDTGKDTLEALSSEVVGRIRRTLIEQETAYQQAASQETFSSLWAHSSRVARIAGRLARAESVAEEPAVLAGLLHDTGKFAQGSYHEGDTPEEERAARKAETILSGTIYEKWLPAIREAILSTYLEGEATGDIGRVLYDADCLDKLGNMGVVQFFAKRALRRQFLDDDVLIRASVELTYAHHAPETLKTATGRSLARERSIRTQRFYTGLLEEWRQLGLGAFAVRREEIAGIVCILVIPGACPCGGGIEVDSDILDTEKCRSVVVKYRCSGCGREREFSFCLPHVKGLPPVRGQAER